MLNAKKIALGYEIRSGPWGGLNQFLISFKSYFEPRGIKVVSRLEDDLDLIILINPQKESGTFDHNDIRRYKRHNPKVKVIHRINDNDKARDTHNKDKLRLEANKVADAVIFISEWLRDYYIKKGFDINIPHTVIRNGANESIFNPQGYIPWQKTGPMKIVTHHWSCHWNKGSDIYQYFDELLDDPWLRNIFEFTIVGSWPKEICFKNTKKIPCLIDKALADELKKHHVYLTAARWEACGMHQLEGACCGLPILFIDEGGGAVECCSEYGIQFTKKTFVLSLFKMLEQYEQFQTKMKDFPLNATEMMKRYEKFIIDLLHAA